VSDVEGIRKMEAEHRQLEAESLVEAARERQAITDEELMREALKALKPAADLLRTEARKHHANLEPVQELRILKVFNPARVAIDKLEERLLRE
jgi:SpoU rRNA methylase family enzyme